MRLCPFWAGLFILLPDRHRLTLQGVNACRGRTAAGRARGQRRGRTAAGRARGQRRGRTAAGRARGQRRGRTAAGRARGQRRGRTAAGRARGQRRGENENNPAGLLQRGCLFQIGREKNLGLKPLSGPFSKIGFSLSGPFWNFRFSNYPFWAFSDFLDFLVGSFWAFSGSSSSVQWALSRYRCCNLATSGSSPKTDC